MTALAAVWSPAGHSALKAQLAAIVRGQTSPTAQASSSHIVGELAFAVVAARSALDGPSTERPLLDSERDLALMADVRIDNRAELQTALGGGARMVAGSDAELVLAAYQKWGEDFVDHLVGDFAVVVWNGRERHLQLFRDPTGQRPLHFLRLGDVIAVASSPQGLLALPEADRSLNFRHLAQFVADIPRRGPETYFTSVSRVEPGQIVTLGTERVHTRSYWAFPRQTLRLSRVEEYEEAFRERLDEATRARLRGGGNTVGSHLSSGMDSGAVTTTAARLLGSGTVVAFTSAPREGFSGPSPRGRSPDESATAAALADAYPNIEHHIVRPGAATPLDVVRRDAVLYAEPLGLPCNQVWWSAIHQQARHRGLSVMLTGESGNLTLSAGSLAVLARYLGEGRWLRWWREARQIRGPGITWRGVLASSVAPWIPRPLWQSLARQANGGSVSEEGAALLQPHYRSYVDSLSRFARGERPQRNEAVQRWRFLQEHDPGNFRRGVFDHWGLDERDVASDRRLAEFCLSLPPELLLSQGSTRRMARLGLADRIPLSHWTAPRGYQGADWFEMVGQEALLAEWNELKQSPAVHQFLDGAVVERVIRSWPREGFATVPVIAKYRLMLLRVMSAARFAYAAKARA